MEANISSPRTTRDARLLDLWNAQAFEAKKAYIAFKTDLIHLQKNDYKGTKKGVIIFKIIYQVNIEI